MKRKLFFAGGITIILLVITVVIVYAFSFGNVDGVWGLIDSATTPGNPGTVVDVIGEIGNITAPGGSDQTRARNATVCGGDVDGDITFADWSLDNNDVFTGLGSYSNSCPTDTTSLFFSEYVFNARSGNPDTLALEIYNGTGTAVDLTGYAVRLYTSATVYTLIDLNNVSLTDNDVFVLAGTNAATDTTQEDQVFTDVEGYRTVVLVSGYAPASDDGLTDDATCSNWATGPTDPENPNLTTGLTTQATWWNQTGPITEWNQVRYGGSGETSCIAFASQSGMAFNGVDEVIPVPIPYSLNQSFLVGKFCHINNPINASNALNTIPLYITMGNAACNEGYTIDNAELEFTYNITLDETSNSGDVGDCTYPSTVVCADAVSAPQSADAFFTCTYDDDPNVFAEYTITALGFIPLDPFTDSCEDVVYDPLLSSGIFVSQEGATNCGCLFGMITEEVPTAVKLASFTASGTDTGIDIAWETATEVDNLGFNLYRSNSLTGERVKLNQGLILSNVAPGSPFGAQYQFTDNSVKKVVNYFYWLEDVDAFGVATLHGPIGANRK